MQVLEADASPKAWGQIAYPLVGLSLAPGLRGTPTRVWLDDEPPLDIDMLAGIVSNGRLYGGVVPLLPNARLDDGALDVALFHGGSPFDATAHAARVLAGRHQGNPNVIMRRISGCAWKTPARPFRCRVDGIRWARRHWRWKWWPAACWRSAWPPPRPERPQSPRSCGPSVYLDPAAECESNSSGINCQLSTESGRSSGTAESVVCWRR